MVLTRRQLAHARRWLPLWSLVLVLMSFGSRAATDLCTLTTHCSQSERTLEKAMPCGRPLDDTGRQRQPDGRRTGTGYPRLRLPLSLYAGRPVRAARTSPTPPDLKRIPYRASFL